MKCRQMRGGHLTGHFLLGQLVYVTAPRPGRGDVGRGVEEYRGGDECRYGSYANRAGAVAASLSLFSTQQPQVQSIIEYNNNFNANNINI